VNIIPAIRELLLRNRKVVIPGFGTFLIHKRPAQLNKITRIISPPSLDILFDSSETGDDAQLSDYLAQKSKKSKDIINEAIDHFVQDAKGQIDDKGNVSFEGMGTLSKEVSGGILFKPDEELLKRLSLVELPKLNIPSVKPEEATPVSNVISQQPVVTGRRRFRWWIPAAIGALLIGTSAIIYFTGFYEKFIPGHKAGVTTLETEDNDRLVFGHRADADSTQIQTDTLREKISRELDERTSRQSALSLEETKKVNLGKKGLSPVLLPKKGDYYMVSIGSFDTQEQAVAAMKKLRSELKQELWVMKR
jgi:nucleoid DNA-binding protein